MKSAVSFSLVSAQFHDDEPITGVRESRRRPDILGAARAMIAAEPLPESALPVVQAPHLALVSHALCPACAGGAHECCSAEVYQFVMTSGVLRGCLVHCSCARCQGVEVS